MTAGVALRALATVFLVVAATNVVVGVREDVTWPYRLAFLCALISCGLMWQIHATGPEDGTTDNEVDHGDLPQNHRPREEKPGTTDSSSGTAASDQR
jgi:hypothetical protein